MNGLGPEGGPAIWVVRRQPLPEEVFFGQRLVDVLRAFGAEGGGFDVEFFDSVAGGHDAAPVGAVAEAVGVAQFVDGFLDEAVEEDVTAVGEAVEAVVETL